MTREIERCVDVSIPTTQVSCHKAGPCSLHGSQPHGAIPLVQCQDGLAHTWWLLQGVTEGPVAAKRKGGADLWPGSQQPGNPSDVFHMVREGREEPEWSRSKVRL